MQLIVSLFCSFIDQAEVIIISWLHPATFCWSHETILLQILHADGLAMNTKPGPKRVTWHADQTDDTRYAQQTKILLPPPPSPPRPPRAKQAYHVSACSKFHEQDEQRVPEVASKQRVAYSDKKVEEVGGHESSEQANAHRVGMNLHVQQL